MAWIGRNAPQGLAPKVALSPPANPTQPEQALILARDTSWVLGARPHGGWTGWRVESAKFADALYEQLAVGPRPLPTCPDHGEAATVEAVYGGHIVRCAQAQCSSRRPAAKADLDLWALYTDRRCTVDSEVLTARHGVGGWFYLCPACSRTEAV